MLRSADIRDLVQKYGREGYLKWQDALLRGVRSPDGRMVKATPENLSIRALWEGLVGPVEETLDYARSNRGYVERPVHIDEAVTSSAFGSAIGQLIAAKVIDAYNAPGYIGDLLVTNMPSKLRGERIVGFTTLQGPKPVDEGEPYDGSTFRDKYVTSVETKRGRLLDITEEAIYFDQTGQVLLRAAALGEAARQERERRIVRGVADVSSTERVYRPNGVAQQLYTASNGNYLSTPTQLVDWTDVQEAFAFHAQNIRDDREPDDSGGPRPIVWTPPIVILTAVENIGTAARIVSATQVGTAPGLTTTADMVTGNPLNTMFPGGVMALSSVYLDEAEGADQWDDASDWLIGNFRKQFVYKEIWPLQVLRAPAQNEQQWEADIVARFKVREYGDLNAIDHRYVIKVNAAA